MTEVGATSPNQWRQGSVLPSDLAVKLQLIPASEEGKRCVVVVSHDCDIANENPELEPDVEVIVAALDPTPNGNLTAAKNPRKLQLSWAYAGASRVIELTALRKQRIPKREVQQTAPDSRYSLGRDELHVLRYWLASRYNRSALPDAFNDRLKKTRAGDDLLKAVERHGFVTGVYVLLDTLDERPSDDPAPYRIDMVLAFAAGDEPEKSQAQAGEIAARVERDFAKRCYDGTTQIWQWLHLASCSAVSEDDLRVSDVKRLQQLYLDYLSLRTDPQGATAWGVKN
jgi:hypothetical protein